MTIYYNKTKQLFIGQIYLNNKRKSFYGKTERDVREKIENALKSISSVPNLRDFLVSWFEMYKVNTYKKPTYEKELNRSKRIRESFLGDMPLDQIKPSDVQQFINELELSPKSILSIISLLKQCLKQVPFYQQQVSLSKE